MEKTIEHQGSVYEIGKNSLKIAIIGASSCSSCHVKGACSVSDAELKIVEVIKPEQSYELGEQVSLIANESLGFKALFLGYLLPFLLLFTTLIISSYFIENEAITGGLSLAILLPYYAALFIYQKKIKKVFEFKIRKV